jgi:hypothetical protein
MTGVQVRAILYLNPANVGKDRDEQMFDVEAVGAHSGSHIILSRLRLPYYAGFRRYS